MENWFTPVAPEESKIGEIGKKELTINGLTFYCHIFRKDTKVLGFNEYRDVYTIRGREPTRGISFGHTVDMKKYSDTTITADMFWVVLSRELQRDIKQYFGEKLNPSPGDPDLSGFTTFPTRIASN